MSGLTLVYATLERKTLFSLLGRFASLRFLRQLPWLLGSGQFAAFLRSPPGFVDLAAAGNSQSIRRHVFSNCRTCGDVCAVPDAHGRHQRGVAADEDFVPDRRWMLVEAVVIAGDRARADVALGSDLRVAQVREVHGLRAFADDAFLEFHKIADAHTGFQVTVLPQSREWADDDAVVEAALRHHAMRLDGHVVAEDCIGKYASRSNGAARANLCFPKQLYAGFEDGVFARGHVRIDQHGLR